MTAPRIRAWPRANTLVLTIGAGQLTELGTALTDADNPVLSARVYLDDQLATLTPISGANAISMPWDATRAQWIALMPYVAAFDALRSARVVVTVTIAGVTERLLDASAPFTRADGR